jgi:hypothetical protein
MPSRNIAALSLVSLALIGLAGSKLAIAAEGGKPVHIVGSTVKLEQLIGDYDKHRKAPTMNQTYKRYGIRGTDLGYSFEHEGKIVFLFGDTLGKQGGDVMGYSETVEPEKGLRVDFFTDRRGNYLKIEPEGISMKGFEVPVSGISIGGKMYVAVKTNHSRDRSTDIAVLTHFDENKKTFKPLREISRLPDGKIITMSMRQEPEPISGLPGGGPRVLIWSSGVHRKSHAYLSAVPVAAFESGKDTRYFAGLDAGGRPLWSDKEAESKPVVEHPTIGDLSVTWNPALKLWLMTYDSRKPRGVIFRFSRMPWGPWSDAQIILHPKRDRVHEFIHQAGQNDGLAGPVIGKVSDPEQVQGGFYAPYVIERFSRVAEDKLNLYYVLSTWNPYVVVLMKSVFKVERAAP